MVMHPARQAYLKQYYLRNKDKIRENAARYTEENKENLKIAGKLWREKHKEVLSAKKADYRHNNKEAIKARNREYYLRSGEKRKERRQQHKILCLMQYSGGSPVCAHPDCGITDVDVLVVDHIEGGGIKHRNKVNAKGSMFYEYLIRNAYPVGFQVLCANHNLKKEIERVRSMPACEYRRVLRNASKVKCIEYYSGGTMQCAICKVNDIDVLTLDHTNNDGAQHRRDVGCAEKVRQRLIREEFPSGFQVLCANHNWKKEVRRRYDDASCA